MGLGLGLGLSLGLGAGFIVVESLEMRRGLDNFCGVEGVWSFDLLTTILFRIMSVDLATIVGEDVI